MSLRDSLDTLRQKLTLPNKEITTFIPPQWCLDSKAQKGFNCQKPADRAYEGGASESGLNPVPATIPAIMDLRHRIHIPSRKIRSLLKHFWKEPNNCYKCACLQNPNCSHASNICTYPIRQDIVHLDSSSPCSTGFVMLLQKTGTLSPLDIPYFSKGNIFKY